MIMEDEGLRVGVPAPRGNLGLSILPECFSEASLQDQFCRLPEGHPGKGTGPALSWAGSSYAPTPLLEHPAPNSAQTPCDITPVPLSPANPDSSPAWPVLLCALASAKLCP